MLKDWILTDLLSATTELDARRLRLAPGTAEDGLVMSSLPFRPIQLARPALQVPERNALTQGEPNDAGRINVPWWPISIRKATLARFIDITVVISAVLLFCIIVAELTDMVPSWSVLAFATLGLGVVFTLLYAWLCRFLLRGSLGKRLAQLAATESSDEIPSAACDAP